jgi:hypothetical protein
MVLFRFEISLPCPWYFRLKNGYMNEGNGSVQFFRIEFYIRWQGSVSLFNYFGVGGRMPNGKISHVIRELLSYICCK